jgi:diguanylate cyclase (GGDEF)-like protein
MSVELQLSELAREAGVMDLFVFRRIADRRFAHLGGVGRGEGWAGIVEVDLTEATILRDALASGQETRLDSATPTSVFGPYFARSAIAVPLPPDTVVVMGSPDQPIEASGELLRRLSEIAASAIEHVSPAKRLGDELEVLQAVQTIAQISADSVDETMKQVAASAAEALSCEVAIIYLHDGERLATASRGWQLAADEATLRGALRSLQTADIACPLCVQDAGQQPLPAPLGLEKGIRSFYLLALDDPAGYLLLLHTDAQPRGFTLLCRELGLRLVDVASDLLSRALARERLHADLDDLNRQARRDPLTGLANRLSWSEALAAAEADETAWPVSVIILDVDHLKQANDERGHPFGDSLLRQAAACIRSAVRGRDVVARIGGDEFAILMHQADADGCHHVVERIEANVAAQQRIDGAPLSISLGFATAGADDVGDQLSNVISDADQMLIQRKQQTSLRLSA